MVFELLMCSMDFHVIFAVSSLIIGIWSSCPYYLKNALYEIKFKVFQIMRLFHAAFTE